MHIIGHEENINKLKSIISSSNIGHAYIFSGVFGIGKKLIALNFAKSILCEKPIDGVACGECESCLTFDNISDFRLITPDEKGSIKVEAIRNLTDEMLLKPTTSSRKVFIIDDAETMTEAAQNALLKSLEEPPIYATIVLITSNKEKIISTIKSRCVDISFKSLTDEELKHIIGNDYSEDIIKLASGSVEKYNKLKDSDYIEYALNLEKILSMDNLLDINSIMMSLKKYKLLKENIDDILDILIIRASQNLEEDSLKVSRQIEIIEKVRNNISRNGNLDIQLDYLAVNIWELNKK